MYSIFIQIIVDVYNFTLFVADFLYKVRCMSISVSLLSIDTSLKESD